jgi:hypothetical protein
VGTTVRGSAVVLVALACLAVLGALGRGERAGARRTVPTAGG